MKKKTMMLQCISDVTTPQDFVEETDRKNNIHVQYSLCYYYNYIYNLYIITIFLKGNGKIYKIYKIYLMILLFKFID